MSVASVPGLVVPAYFHPAAEPQLWGRLADLAWILRCVIVNVHDGPGDEVDPCYTSAVDRVRASRVRLVGYVDTDYGQRTATEIVADVEAYHQHYGITGVFLDQVSAELAELDHYAEIVRAVRAAGAAFVALNPGTHPHPGYLDLANLTVTFEGPWADYAHLVVPSWLDRYPPARVAHLVHSLPRDAFDRGLELVRSRGAGSGFLTDSSGGNPWDRVPALLTGALALQHYRFAAGTRPGSRSVGSGHAATSGSLRPRRAPWPG
jgi:hypothetical protein